VQVPQPSSPRVRPTCRPSFLFCPPFYRSRVATVVPAVAMALASMCARTRLSSRPRARAPTHVHAFAREGGRPDPFIPLSLDRSELASVSPQRAEVPPSAVLFHPDGASARLFLSSPWRTTQKPKGFFCTRRPTYRGGRKGSGGSRASTHSRPGHTAAHLSLCRT
jgi:hypothetical protein